MREGISYWVRALTLQSSLLLSFQKEQADGICGRAFLIGAGR